MKNYFFSLTVMIVLTAGITSSCNNQSADSKIPAIIPKPASVKWLNSDFTITPGTTLYIESNNEKVIAVARFLKERLQKEYGIDLLSSETRPDLKNTILLLESPENSASEPEGYMLQINKEGIQLEGSPAGIFYGIQTLLQMLPANGSDHNEISIPCCEIADQPRFPWRGMHLDVSRHFFGPDAIKNYIDLMAMYKLNVFHWHLTDDQGWRIEIDAYPLLTEQGAWREGTGKEPWSYMIHPAVEGKPRYGGFYTKEEILDIIKYAGERMITVVPEIELPGHSWAALYAYPELSCSGVPWKKPDHVPFEFTDPFCVGNEQTFVFFEKVLNEVIDLFPSQYIHIGGDECKKTPWETCKKCQLRMKSENLENVEELQSYFIKRIEKIVSARGRQIIGWDEILEGGLAPGAAVMSWRGEAGGIEAAKMGHPVVMTPGNNLYLSQEQFDYGKSEGKGVLTLEKVYNYNPVPEELTEDQTTYVLGAQGCMWTENTPDEEVLMWNLMPRMTALAELTWTPEEDKNFADFITRLEQQLPIFDKLEIGYAIPPPAGLSDELFVDKEMEITLEKLYASSEIYYTTDGEEPDKKSLRYSSPFQVTDNAVVKAKTYMPSGRSGETVSGVYKRVSLEQALQQTNQVPGLNMSLFSGEITTLNDFQQLIPLGQDISPEFVIPENMPADFYGISFDGYIMIPADGIYTFYLSSDDGSRLYIHNNLLIDHDGVHGMGFKKGKAALSTGLHPIRLEYFENRYGEGLEVEMDGPGLEREEIPASMLFHMQ